MSAAPGGTVRKYQLVGPLAGYVLFVGGELDGVVEAKRKAGSAELLLIIFSISGPLKPPYSRVSQYRKV